MAKFNAEGIEGLCLSMQEFAEIPDDVVEAILEAGGKVVVEAQKQKISSLGLVKTGKLLKSIEAFSKVGKKNSDWNRRYVLVYPYGKHGHRNRRKIYKVSKRGRKYSYGGDVKTVTNNDVGFIHEFGAPKKGIKAKQWMRKANEESAEAMVKAEFEVYDQWLQSKNL